MNSQKRDHLEKTYERILNVGFCMIPYEDLSDITAPDPMVYGTAKDERIHSYEGIEALFKAQLEQIGDMKPSIDRKRITLRISNDGNQAIIVEEITLTLSSPEVTHTIFMRASCVMEYLDNRWKLTHWHTSTPVDTENDPWHMEEWKREKEKLQQLVDEQTAALQQNNRELQIEAALEKVRSSSLAMQKTEDLREVVKVLFEQMQGLSVDMGFASVSIFIFEDGSRNITQWLPLPNGVSSLRIPYFDHPISSDLFDAKENGEDFFTKIYTLKEKNTWLKHGFEHTDYKDLTEEFKSSLLQAPGYAIAITLAKNSGICIPSFEGKLPRSENIQIMKRVGKVFEQAYIRFLDLQKAESQAREAQIEMAVERVRAKALAMHKSTEILQVAVTLKEQMEGLNLSGVTAATIYLEHDDSKIRVWDITELEESENGPQLSSDFIFRLKDTDPGLWVRRIWNASEKYSMIEMSGDDFIKCEKWIREFDETAADNYREFIRAAKIDHTWHPTVQLEKGKLNLDFTVPPPVEMEFILPKMGAAFDLAYRRFLDLQKAEAQAKEAQVEAALERVRSRSMAMHRSAELRAVVDSLYGELKSLEINFDNALIQLIKDDTKDLHLWISTADGLYDDMIHWPASDLPHFDLMYAARVAQSDVDISLSTDQINAFFTEYFGLPYVPQERKAAAANVRFFRIFGTYQKNTCVFLMKYSPGAFSASEKDIITRFAKVFEQTYTRFLDLQKAEEQAREAKIEAALERVRSRSLAMHHSSELSAVVDTLMREFTNLEFTLTFCIINLIDEQDMSNTVWAANPETGKDPESYYMKFEDYPFHHAMWDAWKAQKKRFVYTLEGEEKKIYDEYLYNDTEFRRFPKHVQEANKALEKYVAGFTFFKYSGLQTVSVNPISEDELEILERFGRVFEQAYTRFLDLQKAEAQAREAQIEAALERVRSKSLAMHDSQDLHEVVTIVFGQLESIGLFMNSVLLHELVYDSKNQHFWVAANGQVYPEQTEIPISKNAFFTRFEEARWNGESFFTQTLSKRQKDAFFEHYFKQSNHSDVPQKRKDYIYSCESLNRSTAIHKYTALSVSRYDNIAYSKEENKVIKRFSQVFEQSYQRYLDLKKAEAQAREAQIVASMERVRAATMAMHQSNELSLVLSKLFEQFDVLGIKPSHAVLTLIDKEKNTMNFRTTGKNGYQVLAEQEVDLNVMNAWVDTAEKWKKSNPNAVNVNEFPPEILPDVWEVYKDILASMPKKARPEIKDFPDGLFITEGYCRFGYIGFAHHRKPTEEEKDIVRRIAAEFGTLYQRFLDLKKSEAQAREAQIETALEKVRSRTMAMQKGDELQEVAVLLYKELIALGVTNFVTCGYVEVNEAIQRQHTWVTSPGGDTMGLFHLPLTGDDTFDARYAAWKKQQTVFHQSVAGQIRSDHLEYAITTFNSKEAEEMVRGQFPDPTVFYCFNFSHGYLHLVGGSLLEKEDELLLARFTKVFEQTYTRFLDLQKAESQAREALIEAALERVRSRSMAMHKSEELLDVISVVSEQLEHLNFRFIHVSFANNDRSQDYKFWTAYKGMSKPVRFTTPYLDIAMFNNLKDAQEKSLSFYSDILTKKEHNEWHKHLLQHGGYKIFSKEENEFIMSRGMARSIAINPNIILILANYASIPYSEDENKIIERFGQVFEQSYTRFLDLKKAEEQAREAQIEVALEKVRSRTMGMQSSDELPEVANMLFLEVQALGINAWSCGYNILDEDHTTATCSMSSEGTLQAQFQLRLWGEASFDEMGEFINNNKDMLVQELDGEAIASHYAHMKSFPDLKPTFDELDRLGLSLPTYQINHLCKFSHGFLLFITYEKVPDAHDIFKRFTKVFDQTYTRFLDLQKAEARAREAQIQTALERVRSHSMGMQSTSDFANVTTEMFNQLRSFGEDLFATGIVFCDKHDNHVEQWHSIPGAGMLSPMIVPIDLDYIHQYRYDQWKAGNPLFSIEIPSDFIEQHFEDIFKLPSAQITIKDLESRNAPMPAPPPWEIDYGASFKHGYILVSSLKPIENMDILPRFAQVFEQAYIRFLDLQKAEAQAREAQIENALEKVRSRSLAMQSPNELIEVAQLLREEMGALGVEALETSSIYIQDENQDTTQCWFTIKDKEQPDNSVSDQMTIDLKKTWVGRKMEAFYGSSQKQTSIVMKGDHRKEWINYCERQSDLFSTTKFYGDTIPERTYHLYKFSDGFIGAASPGDISAESWDLLRRATTVFSFAYTRFRDLQIAEASARTALRQASLDRVRADISSMRNAKDLERITPLVFNELTTLGIPFIRCGVFIVHEKTKNVEVYLSSPEGKSLAVMNLPFSANDMTTQSVSAWKKKDVYIQHWDKADFINWSKSLQAQGYVKDLNTYQGDKAAPESLHLHFIPFNQGLLYVGAAQTLNDEQIDLVKALSESFAIAYARYEDFVKLEKAKAEVEIAMNELKATQSQLIQSEKMASLGELTAGIAHEIQNPLNFVNNFSEVSNELIDEIQEERAKNIENRDEDLVDEILGDIKQNLEKINHHGKRADGIVKGMLQHSRSSSGTKEPTDINALCDEYLRLSYHGLRAKDKSFNATLHTDFEEGLDKVNVIPQDLGRVVLNLLTNAFYAVNERKQQNPTEYEPSVSIATKTIGKNLEITVKDNGNGMPQEVADKIFQPFFTTKPTGQGTGLGLSMSYDIVSKGHGGELKVDTKHGEGTLFTIRLPKIKL